MAIWFASLFVLRIIPQYHWHPIQHIALSAFRGSALRLDVHAGLGSLRPGERGALRTAVVDRLPVAGDCDGSSEGARLVRLLRQAVQRGGVPVADSSDLDAGISLFLFSDQPVAVRLAKMRELLSAGVSAHDLRTLEDLRDNLARAPAEAWGTEAEGDGRQRGASLAAKGA